MADCLFCKIAQGTIPVTRVAEDEHGLVFPDINPQAPTHLLVIPKQHVASLHDVSDPLLLGRLNTLVQRVVRERGLDERGFRVVANMGADAGQTVFHLHLHLLAGRHFAWPPG